MVMAATQCGFVEAVGTSQKKLPGAEYDTTAVLSRIVDLEAVRKSD